MKRSLITLALAAAATCVSAHAAFPAQMSHAAIQIQMPWDQPPAEFKEIQRQGFHAGVQAAINDYDHHRAADWERRKEYRHPHVDPSLREDYRKGFRRGYHDAMHHLEDSNGRHS